MTIVLCGDQPIYLKKAAGILGIYTKENGMTCDLVTFADSLALCEQNEIMPDILFLDIRMNGQDGIETGRRVNRKWEKMSECLLDGLYFLRD